MAEPFLGEVRMMSFGFPPKGWARCDGAMLPINQNQALFSLLGTNFGGNGQTTFGLPDLRGRVPLDTGRGFTMGERGGEEAHTVTLGEMPTHTHTVMASSLAADNPIPTIFAATNNAYGPPAAQVTTLAPAGVSTTGGSQPHTNMQPYTVLSFCIALQGIFPSQN